MRIHSMTAVSLLLAGLLTLAGCGSRAAGAETARTPAEIASALQDSQAELPALTELTPEDAGFSDYLEQYYQLSSDTVTDGVIRCAGGAEAGEIAVLLLADEDTAEDAAETLEGYLDRRAADFAGYLPEQAALVEAGVVLSRGTYAALVIGPEPEQAEAAFLSCFGEEALPERPVTPLPSKSEPDAPLEPASPTGAADGPEETRPPAETRPLEEPPVETASPEVVPTPGPEASAAAETGYDPEAVRSAWQSGDVSGLSGKNRAILDACRTVVDEVIKDGMSNYEKELAIHDWMLAWGCYDSNSLSHVPDYQTDPDNDNPYGFLVNGKGICSGYSSTFQLLMDLLDIECATVEGTAHAGAADHTWNLVRLDGEWYAVDVTWDDPSSAVPVGEAAAHRYFNVTSEFLWQTDHQWDRDAVAEAEGTAYAWTAS